MNRKKSVTKTSNFDSSFHETPGEDTFCNNTCTNTYNVNPVSSKHTKQVQDIFIGFKISNKSFRLLNF